MHAGAFEPGTDGDFASRLDNAGWRDLSNKAYDTATRYTWEDATTLFESALRRAREKSRQAAVVM